MAENVEGSGRARRERSTYRGRKKFVQMQPSPDLYDYIDGIFQRTGVSHSEVVRTGIRLMMDLDEMAAAGVNIQAPSVSAPGLPLRFLVPRIARTEA